MMSNKFFLLLLFLTTTIISTNTMEVLESSRTAHLPLSTVIKAILDKKIKHYFSTHNPTAATLREIDLYTANALLMTFNAMHMQHYHSEEERQAIIARNLDTALILVIGKHAEFCYYKSNERLGFPGLTLAQYRSNTQYVSLQLERMSVMP